MNFKATYCVEKPRKSCVNVVENFYVWDGIRKRNFEDKKRFMQNIYILWLLTLGAL